MCGEPSFVCLDPCLHDLRPMCRQAINEEGEMPPALAALQLCKIADEVSGAHRFALYRKDKARADARGMAQYRPEHGTMLPATRREYMRSFAALRPGVADYGTIGESCFIVETKGGIPPEPLFLSIGHTCLRHARIAVSFRSRARRTGL